MKKPPLYKAGPSQPYGLGWKVQPGKPLTGYCAANYNSFAAEREWLTFCMQMKQGRGTCEKMERRRGRSLPGVGAACLLMLTVTRGGVVAVVVLLLVTKGERLFFLLFSSVFSFFFCVSFFFLSCSPVFSFLFRFPFPFLSSFLSLFFPVSFSLFFFSVSLFFFSPFDFCPFICPPKSRSLLLSNCPLYYDIFCIFFFLLCGDKKGLSATKTIIIMLITKIVIKTK